MDFGVNKTPAEVIKEGACGGTFLGTFILVLLECGTKHRGKKLAS